MGKNEEAKGCTFEAGEGVGKERDPGHEKDEPLLAMEREDERGSSDDAMDRPAIS